MDHPVASPGTLDARSFRGRLYASSWFSTLDAALQNALTDIATVRRLGAGELLFQRGDAPDGLYCVVEGTIRIGVTSADGREALPVVLEPVNWSGETGVFNRQPRTYDAYADDHTTLLHVSQAAPIALLDGSPALLYVSALPLTYKLRLTFIVLEETAPLFAPVHVAWRLLLMADGYGDLCLGARRMLYVPQEQLAQLLSLSRQTVNQVSKDFGTRGVLELVHGEIEVLDFSRLHRLGHEI